MEYLVTPVSGEQFLVFPLKLTSEYYERSRKNEARQVHVTSLCLVRVGDRILCIDKREKDRKKGRTVPPEQILSLDLAGSGHGVRKEGMTVYTFEDSRKDALKELSEEICLNGRPLEIDVDRIRFRGFAEYFSEENKEISCVWTCELPEEYAEAISCRDSVYLNGIETDLQLPSYLFSAEDIRKLFGFARESRTVAIQDGIGRLLDRTGGDLELYFEREGSER